MKLWMKYLLSISSLIIVSCVLGRDNNWGDADYHYVNTLTEKLYLIPYNEYTVGDTVIIDSLGYVSKFSSEILHIPEGEETIGPFDSFNPHMGLPGSDSTLVLIPSINKSRVYINDRYDEDPNFDPCEEKNSLYCNDSYQWESIGGSSYKYTFTFKAEDFQ